MSTKTYEDSGTLGKNERKKNDRSPDYTGSVTFGAATLKAMNDMASAGKPIKLYISGWKRRSARGDFLSLKMNPPMAGGATAGASKPAGSPPKPSEVEDDIPF